MARDIRELFKGDEVEHVKMPENHKKRFLEKLDHALPEKRKVSRFYWLQIAASAVIFLGLGIGGYNYFLPKERPAELPKETPAEVIATQDLETKTLGDISPGLKKVEDYYLASINLELSKIKYTPDTKDVFDGYLLQLDELDKEYKRLSLELTESGPSELTVNALIDNLKLRLNLLYRLRAQLKELNTSEFLNDDVSKSI